MYKLLKSKKAIGVDDFIPLMFTLAIFIIILIFASFSQSSSERAINEDISFTKETIEATDNLLNFLQMPIENFDINFQKADKSIILKDITISDLIVLSYKEDNYEYLEEKSKEFFDPIINSEESIFYRISFSTDSQGTIHYFEIGRPKESFKIKKKAKTAEMIIPIDNNKDIKINFLKQEITPLK